MEEKKKIILVILILILIVIVSLVLGIYLFNNDRHIDNENIRVKEDIKSEEEQIKKEDVETDEYLKYEEILSTYLPGGDMYDVNGKTKNELSSDDLLKTYLKYNGSMYCYENNDLSSFSDVSLNNINGFIKEFLGIDSNLVENDIFKDGNMSVKYYNGFYPEFFVRFNNKIYNSVLCAYDDAVLPYYENKIVDVKTKDNQVYIYRKVAFGTFRKDISKDGMCHNEMSDCYGYDFSNTLNGPVVETKYIGDELNWNQYNTFVYVFDIVDGKYQFNNYYLEK